MSVYRHKGRNVYTMDFTVRGQRVHETTGMRSKVRAERVEANRRRDIEDGIAGIRKPAAPKLFKNAAAEYLEFKAPTVRPRTLDCETANLKRLLPQFGNTLVTDIDASDVARYQKARLADGLAERTVSMELGTLRAIMKRSGQWERIAPDVRMPKARRSVGQALTDEQYGKVVDACNQSQSRMLAPFIQIAMETGARTGVIKSLVWENVNFAEEFLTWGQDKTDAGTGRTVPLSERALLVLKLWAENFPNRQPSDFVFPRERYGAKGHKFENPSHVVYAIDPTQPMGSIKTAWNGVRKRLGITHRLHDLRHTAVSRMIDENVALTTVAKIVGWAPSTTVYMSTVYGHSRMDKMREAVNKITPNVTPETRSTRRFPRPSVSTVSGSRLSY